MNISLQSPVSILFGVGEKYARLLDAKLGIKTIENLLNHFPQRYEDYSNIKSFGDVQNEEVVTIIGKIVETKNIFTRRIKIQEIVIEDFMSVGVGLAPTLWATASVAPTKNIAKITFFNQPFILQSLAKGMTIAISGTAEKIGGKLQFKSPEYEIIKNIDIRVNPLEIRENPSQKNEFIDNIRHQLVHTGRLTPIYPETRGISSKWLRARIFPLIKDIDNLIEEFLDDETLKKENLIDLKKAYKQVHFPENHQELAASNFRLAFNEILLTQITSILKRKEWESGKSKPISVTSYEKEIQNLISSLNFTLTGSQNRAIENIFSDISKVKPMNRLLEGDVGSGKTVVATAAMYLTYLNGYSSAIMCPTEILANQHYSTIKKLLEKNGAPIHLVTSSTRKDNDLNGFRADTHGLKEKNIRKNPLEIRKNRDIGIYIGTHALIQEKIEIPNLNLVVIDEQHRFGVEQRATLVKKGENPHVLTMTATPIPRTIALTIYANLDLSTLENLPNKKKIKTWVIPQEKREKAYSWIETKILKEKTQCFIVCPFISPSETMESVKNATQEFEKLKKLFPKVKLELLTGKTKPKIKDKVMTAFAKQEFDILVATPVVEVGVDIPNATIMLIEGSERFGLAQLHQLRGRVGRRGQESFCLLFVSEDSQKSEYRLKNLETIDNGLRLAEIDLKLRGAGNIFGKEQHGEIEFKKANISDLYLIEKSKAVAIQVAENPSNYPALQKMLKNSKIGNITNN